jgi:hypothetical protein
MQEHAFVSCRGRCSSCDIGICWLFVIGAIAPPYTNYTADDCHDNHKHLEQANSALIMSHFGHLNNAFPNASDNLLIQSYVLIVSCHQIIDRSGDFVKGHTMSDQAS